MVSNKTPVNDNQQSMAALKNSAMYIIGAILIALIGYFGWSYYQNKAAKVDTVAADKYMDIQEQLNEIELAAQNPNIDEQAQMALQASRSALNDSIESLVSNEGQSIYAWQALMLQARQLVDNGEYTKAADVYKRAMDIEVLDAGLEAITHLRYASALLGANEVSDALTAASVEVPMAFEASKQELLGDIYSEQKDEDKAARAYQNAWRFLQKRQEERAILKLKMESLGLTPEVIEAKPSVVSTPTIDLEQARLALQQEATPVLSETVNKDAAATTKVATDMAEASTPEASTPSTSPADPSTSETTANMDKQ